jgi:hypothetical protein
MPFVPRGRPLCGSEHRQVQVFALAECLRSLTLAFQSSNGTSSWPSIASSRTSHARTAECGKCPPSTPGGFWPSTKISTFVGGGVFLQSRGEVEGQEVVHRRWRPTKNHVIHAGGTSYRLRLNQAQ